MRWNTRGAWAWAVVFGVGVATGRTRLLREVGADGSGNLVGTVDSTAGGVGAHPSQVLVAPKPGIDVRDVAKTADATVLSSVPGTGWWVLGVGQGHTAVWTVGALSVDPRVERSTLDEILDSPEGKGSTIPAFGDDPMASVATQSAVARTNAPSARERATGAGVLVAVLDSGASPNHPLLAGRVDGRGWDFVDGDPDPLDAGNGLDDDLDGDVDEGVGHGTFVASLVLAVAPDARILPLRVLNSDGAGTASAVATAIGYAAQHGARVVNASLAWVNAVPVIESAIRSARNSGVVFCAATGNDGVERVDYPAAHAEVLAVAALSDGDARAPFSQFGAATDLCAPGEDVIGAFPGAPCGTARWSGTSFSAALVAGGLALVRERFPGWAPAQVEDHVRLAGALVAESDGGSLVGARLDLDAATR